MAEFGEKRIKDSPIAESVLVGAGIGAAMRGLRPIVEIMTINFSLLACDQIINIAAKINYMSGGQINVPLVIRTVSGGGNQLAATHSQSFEGFYASVPGLKVVAPATPADARGLLKSALTDQNTVIFVEHSLLYGVKGPVPEGEYAIPIGKADVKREGKDITIISYLRMTQTAMMAAQALAKEGIEAEIVDLRSLRPLDLASALASIRKTHRAIIVEEMPKFGGFGGEVAAGIMEHAFDDLDAPVLRVSGKDVPTPYNRELEQMSFPTPKDVIDAVKSIV
jgi:pyruvate dehydrogenase E1 component beta subunit